jgi:predicted lipoprotein with Yx(FWY)xxD motif
VKIIAISMASYVALIATPGIAAEPENKQHPGVVALSQPEGIWTYKSFPELTALYISKTDTPGKSNCDETCTTAWPPLLATSENAGEKIGYWTVIKRPNGQLQWAYRDQPVYLRFHDIPLGPYAREVEGFRVLQP